MKQPSEKAVNAAAQLWCQPQHEKKEMDTDFGESIARALDAFAAEAVKAEREACERFFEQARKWHAARVRFLNADFSAANAEADAIAGMYVAWYTLPAAIRTRGKE